MTLIERSCDVAQKRKEVRKRVAAEASGLLIRPGQKAGNSNRPVTGAHGARRVTESHNRAVLHVQNEVSIHFLFTH